MRFADEKYGDYLLVCKMLKLLNLTTIYNRNMRCCLKKNKILMQIAKFNTVKKISKCNNYDCVHIHVGDAFNEYIYYIVFRSKCKNIIVHSHSSGAEDSSSKNLAKVKNLLHIICKKIMQNKNITRLACSDLAGKWLYSSNCKFEIIKNGIEISKFVFNMQTRNKIRTRLNIGNKFVIGHVGRFSAVKNHDFLIDIFRKVYEINKNAILLIVGGNGPLENQIKKKVYDLGLNDAVIFYGTTPDVNELYQAMDCFVLPSYFEGMPIVLVEAQTAALKCLCSDTITDEAKITDFLEYMPLSKDAEEWAEKILSYNSNYVRKDMSDEVTTAGYDIRETAKRLEELYNK